MINLADVAPEKLNQMFVLLQQEFIKRKWKATIPYEQSPHCYIDRGDGKILHIFSATPPTTSFAAAHLANDKFATHQLLGSVNIPQFDTILVDGTNPNTEQIRNMLEKHGTLVVKPKDGGHGKGITLDCTTVEEVIQNIPLAVQHNKSGVQVLVQEQYKPKKIYEVRILCIGYKYVAALLRKPARVFGDGTSTIRELVIVENRNPQRGVAYRSRLATIDITKVEKYLADKINQVPNDGEEVEVLGIANYGAGGEIVDITDVIPLWLREQAEEASRLCDLPVAGVDFMTAASPGLSASKADLQAVLIEINKCPSLDIHDHPTQGSSRGVIAKYADYLASL